ncbi:hypothetical protein ANN_27387 [Periplaneta americana]|uniref:Peptidase aspartic putative domain-containing protein n=1 Tax=Periplaneta americana TaxID=6978 RepID=A0ABQ8RVS4_PERAM|nr:hypothetical protein ANN_27387 [Periplaneta americana]
MEFLGEKWTPPLLLRRSVVTPSLLPASLQQQHCESTPSQDPDRVRAGRHLTPFVCSASPVVTGLKIVRSICSNPRSTEPTTHPTKFTSVNRINAEATDFTSLQTARVWVTGPTVDELKLEVVDCRDLAIASFETSSTSSPRRLVRFSMKSIWTNSTARITGFESTHAFSPQPAVPHDVKILAHTRKLQLADPKDHTEDMTLPIEIIIGGDHYWKVVKDSSPICISPTVVLIPSKLGWILSGNRSGTNVSSTIVNYIHSEQGSGTSSDTFYIDRRDITETLLEGPASKRQPLRVTSLQETMVKDRDKISQLHQELVQLSQLQLSTYPFRRSITN